MLEITSIRNGIVIDHIKQGVGMKIYNYLNLSEVKDCQIALIMNASSNKNGKKDIIKIENRTDLALDVLGVFDPNMTINIIKDEKVVKKINLELPEKITGIFKCKNPRCITSDERSMVQKFDLVDKKKRTYKCHYCDTFHEF